MCNPSVHNSGKGVTHDCAIVSLIAKGFPCFLFFCMVHPIPTSPFIQLNDFCTCITYWSRLTALLCYQSLEILRSLYFVGSTSLTVYLCMRQPLFDLTAYPSHRPTSSSSHYYHIQLLITLCQDLLCSTIIVGQRVAWVTILDTHTHTHTQTNKHTRCSEGKEARSIVVCTSRVCFTWSRMWEFGISFFNLHATPTWDSDSS